MDNFDLNSTKVLVVDDHTFSRMVASDLLALEGYNVLEAENGPAAIDIVLAEDPDLILLDVMMPGMDGYEVCHHHERWDGSGYPDGRTGNDIPYLAQVFQLLDIYDALSSERPYKKCFTPQESIAIMQEEADRNWRNPVLMKSFIEFIYGTEIKKNPVIFGSIVM